MKVVWEKKEEETEEERDGKKEEETEEEGGRWGGERNFLKIKFINPKFQEKLHY